MCAEVNNNPEQDARRILQRLRDAGHQAYWAGGCVRDRLMGRAPKDYDVVTSAPPETVQSLFPKTVPIGKAFGVIGVVRGRKLYEVATFRSESGYADGRRPDTVRYADARQDVERRDFTINALFYDPEVDQVLDFVGGQEDLRKRVIRAVGDPDRRFAEDHLRMLRAIRFAATLDFQIEESTRNAVMRHAPLLARVSLERIRDELTRILLEAIRPGNALQELLSTGLLRVFLPEVVAMEGVEQPPQFHPEGDVFTHTRLMLDRVAPTERSIELMLAILLHDVGKPPTAGIGPGADGIDRIRFDRHDTVGALLTEDILRRLRYPNAVIQTVAHCVRNHMRFMHVQDMRRAKRRALIGSPTFDIELALHRVDCQSSHGDLSNYDFLLREREGLAQEPVLPPAWIRGEDVLSLGIPKGPLVGQWLRAAYAQQLDGNFPDRNALLEWLKRQIQH